MSRVSKSVGSECAAFSCSTYFHNYDGTPSGLHFFKFPQKNPEKRFWCNAIKRVDGMDGFQVRSATCLCQNHFGAPKSSLNLLDRVQSKAIRLINNPNLTNSLQSLSHRRLVADLSIFYRYFHGHCSQEIKNIIPDPVRRARTTRSSTNSHPFQITLPNPRTLARKSSFIPRTFQLWNSLPPTTFPESYNLSAFKSTANKLDLVSLSTKPSPFSQLFLCRGFVIGHIAIP